MNASILTTALLLVMFISPSSAWSNDSTDVKTKGIPLQVSLVNHSWAFPLMSVARISPLYPGMFLGSEHLYLEGKRSSLGQTATIGGFLNQATGSALLAHTDLMYRYSTGFGLEAGASFGIGYMHAFHSRPTYRLNDNNVYEATPNRGKPSALVSLSISTGFDLEKSTGLPIVPFLKYQWMASTPYTDIIPIRPHGLLHLGVRFYVQKQTSK